MVRHHDPISDRYVDYCYDIQRKATREIPTVGFYGSAHHQDPVPFTCLVAQISSLDDIQKLVRFEPDKLLSMELPHILPPLHFKVASSDLHESKATIKQRIPGLDDQSFDTKGTLYLNPKYIYASDFSERLTLWSATDSKRHIEGSEEASMDYFCQWIPAQSQIVNIAKPRKSTRIRDDFRDDLRSSRTSNRGQNPWQRAIDNFPWSGDMLLWKTCIYQLENGASTEIHVHTLGAENEYLSAEFTEIDCLTGYSHRRISHLGNFRLLGDENFLVLITDNEFRIYSFDEDCPLNNEDEFYYEKRVEFAKDRQKKKLESRKAP